MRNLNKKLRKDYHQKSLRLKNFAVDVRSLDHEENLFYYFSFLVPQALPAYVIADCRAVLTPPLIVDEYKIKIEQDEERQDLLERLGNKKVDPSINDAILRWASYEGWLDAVKSLVNKVNVNKKNGNTGMNPILLASFAGHSKIVEFLADVHDIHKIDLNVVGENGMTPIMWASYKGHNKIVDILLDHGVDLSITVVGLDPSDLEKELNVLDIAKRQGHSDIAEKIDQVTNGDQKAGHLLHEGAGN